jgi:dipeptidyl aminopeptidase/acylaminoacyl peptidase
VVALLLCSGLIWAIWSSISSMRTVADLGAASGPIPFAHVPVPQFPDPGSPIKSFPSGVQTFFVDFSKTNDGNQTPGFGMKMRIYRPAGEHAQKSLPCVLVAPAGTNLLVGNDMDADDYHDETLPYAENGIVTIFYSIDGGVGDLESASDAQFAAGYRKFRAARAGLVNGRNALEYALAKLPEVDPKRIYSAGHSSAGTLSLLLASHEKRIAGCIAFAPCSDVEHFLEDIADDAAVSFLLPKVGEFIQRSSPRHHASRLTCPLFVFHADDDAVSPVNESASYVQTVGTPKNRLDFVRVPGGGHYQPMIDDGIPAAISKIQQWGQ